MTLMQQMDKEEFKKQKKQEYHEIFENLQEAILLFSNNSIAFSNQAFNEIFKGVGIMLEASKKVQDNVLDIEAFRLYRS